MSLQPVDRRHRQGPSRQGGRRARRRDGARHRRGRHPVPHRSTRARARRCARRARRPTACSTSRRSAAASRTQPNLTLFQQAVDDLTARRRRRGARVTGVVTQIGMRFEADAVVLTTGTFLSGLIHVGLEQLRGGPRRRSAGEDARRAAARAAAARRAPEDRHAAAPRRPHDRFHARSTMQPGDDPAPVFSLHGRRARCIRARCRAGSRTPTSARTRSSARGLDRSPLFTGVDRGRRPALLPVDRGQGRALRRARRATRSSSSPKALTTHEIYPNGISTSLPFDVQLALVRSIAGCEHAHILRPGYAIEYDYFDPRALQGHARDQGDRAASSSPGRSTARRATRKPRRRACSPGINAGAARARRRRLVRRGATRRTSACWSTTSITRGVTEPYRMFTSRAEYRLQLREDNADLRLTEHGRALGVVDDARWDAFARKRDAIAREHERLKSTYGESAASSPRTTRSACSAQPIEREYALADLLRRPGVTYAIADDAARRGRAGRRSRRRRAGRDRDQVRRLHRPAAARRSRASRAQEDLRLPVDLDYRTRARPLDRSAAEAQPAQAGDDRPGRAHFGHHAGGDLAAARASEARLRRAQPIRAESTDGAPRDRRDRSRRRTRRALRAAGISLAARRARDKLDCAISRCSRNGTARTT